MKLFIITLTTIVLIHRAFAAETEIPEIIKDGLKAYEKGGIKTAAEVWLKDSPLLKTSSMSKFLAAWPDVEEMCGKFKGYELIGVTTISASVRRVYITLLYSGGFMIMKFTCYKSEAGWLIQGLNANSDPDIMLPSYYQERIQSLMPNTSFRPAGAAPSR